MSQEAAIIKPNNVYDVVSMQESQFNSVSTCDSVVWEKEKGYAIQLLQNNDFLNKTAWSNQISLINAVNNVASIGISLNPAKKHAYLVPRDGKVCLDISYMGLLHLAMDCGSILWGQSKIVYSNDIYENTGIDTPPNHTQNTFGDKGKIVGAYCTVKTPAGDYLTEEMDIAALNKIKDSSKAKNGPWKTWFEAMCRKSVIKSASKYWPQSDRVSNAVEYLNESEGNIDNIQTQENNHEMISENDVSMIISEAAKNNIVMADLLAAAGVSDLSMMRSNRVKPCLGWIASRGKKNADG